MSREFIDRTITVCLLLVLAMWTHLAVKLIHTIHLPLRISFQNSPITIFLDPTQNSARSLAIGPSRIIGKIRSLHYNLPEMPNYAIRFRCCCVILFRLVITISNRKLRMQISKFFHLACIREIIGRYFMQQRVKARGHKNSSVTAIGWNLSCRSPGLFLTSTGNNNLYAKLYSQHVESCESGYLPWASNSMQCVW